MRSCSNKNVKYHLLKFSVYLVIWLPRHPAHYNLMVCCIRLLNVFFKYYAAGYLHMIHQMKELITAAGKKVYTLAMGRPNPAKLANFPEVNFNKCAQELTVVRRKNECKLLCCSFSPFVSVMFSFTYLVHKLLFSIARSSWPLLLPLLKLCLLSTGKSLFINYGIAVILILYFFIFNSSCIPFTYFGFLNIFQFPSGSRIFLDVVFPVTGIFGPYSMFESMFLSNTQTDLIVSFLFVTWTING